MPRKVRQKGDITSSRADVSKLQTNGGPIRIELLEPVPELLMGWATSYISDLEAGREVSFRPRGNSMVPLIHSGDLVTVSPDISDLSVGDMVLCKVSGRQYVHKVLAIQGKRYQIGNNRGGVNGWTTSIYGKVTKVSK